MNRIFSYISVFLILMVFLFSPPKGFAQTPNAFSNVNADVPQNSHTWTQTVLIETTSALSCLIAGVDSLDPSQKCLGIDTKTKKIGYVEQEGGAIGGMTTLITALYTPPLHMSDYFQHIAGNFGIVKPVYAQTGIGFQGLSPLLPLWAAFRNIAYLLLVVVFLLIGFAIMLRIKIDPRTVMSLENQLPKIIVGILLITFSFAIAGFVIDMMYVSIYLIAGVLNSAAPAANINTSVAGIQGQNTFEFASGNMGGIASIANTPAAAIGGVVKSLFTGPIIQPVFAAIGAYAGWNWGTQTLQWMTTAIASAGGAIPGVGAIAGLTVGAGWMAIATGLGAFFANYILGLFVQALVFLILAAAILIALFKLWVTLLMAYVSFLLDVILAPFWIIGGLLPESTITFEAWLRDMIANLSVFPVTITMFLLGKIFMTAFQIAPGGVFVPPLIGDTGNVQLIADLIGLAIILMTPGVVQMMRDILKAPGFKYAAQAGKSLSDGITPVKRVGQGTINEFWGIHAPAGGASHGGTPGAIARILGLGGHS
ncbi:MAG: hypothetical protein KBD46_00530 [Candidatus Levybacteria bacterium]|nr:hypothetical protein [Candidatus Levybacteria bacterium]